MKSKKVHSSKAKQVIGINIIIWFSLSLLLFTNVLNAGELHEAAKKGDVEKIKLLIKNETDIDAKDNQGVTSLVWASAYGKTEVVKYLISKGADVNFSLQNGLTALMLATEYGENEVASILVSSGAKINHKERAGHTALNLAVNKDNETIAKLLVNSGADINSRADDGGTALYKAAMRGNKPIVNLLLNNGANPNLYLKKNNNPPRSPLLIAAWNKSLDHDRYRSVIKSLLGHGAKDRWLSSVPGFDPYEFSQLTLSVSDKGTVMVGRMSFILGQHYAARPAKNKSDNLGSGTVSGKVGGGGTNFFSWENKENKDMVTIVVIEDDERNSTLGRVKPPAYIGEGGVIYQDTITSIRTGGPFATVNVNWENRPSTGNVVIKRKGKSLKLQFNKREEASYTLREVSQNEPIEISFTKGTKLLKTVDVDCVIRGATPNSVAYAVNHKE